jgi:hypothetical protein
MSQVLEAFGLLNFTMLRPVLTWRAFLNLRTVYFFNFPNFFSVRGELRIVNQWIRGCTCTLHTRVWSCGIYCVSEKILNQIYLIFLQDLRI